MKLTTIFALALAAASHLNAQTVTGSISGTVTDPSGLPVAGATVTLADSRTGSAREAKSVASGDFSFNGVTPGTYSIAAQFSGFKRLERTGIQLTASERLSTGTLQLEVGAVNESVTVKSEGATVQTASAEHAGVLTASQVDNLMIKGRNVVSLLQLLPGVVDTNDPDSPNRNFGIGLSVNGHRRNANAVSLDGVTTTDSGTGWISALNVSMDAVGEVKVLLNNYQAEFGRMRGANVQMIGKSGTRAFHGTFSYFKRHEQFNANTFFNNRLNVAKPRYRYNTYSYTIGGPVFIPGKFNRDRNKLFFFWSQELWPQKGSTAVQRVNMPTELERNGDFSQSNDVNNRLIPVVDPVTRQPLPGNRLPASRLDLNGQALLKFLPLPNFNDRAISGGQYNYLFQGDIDRPQQMNSLKFDYLPASNDTFAVTWSRQEDKQTGALGLATSSANWPQLSRTFWTRGNLLAVKYQKVFSPTLINEFVFGHNWRVEGEQIPDAEATRNRRDTVGFRLGQMFPSANAGNWIPNASFGGITNPAAITLDSRIPLVGLYTVYNITDNLSKTFASHTVKAGVLLYRGGNSGRAGTSNRGAFAFDRDVNNPLDTGYSYANAMSGVFASYQESNRLPIVNNIGKSAEWFVQDSWKATRRLTVEVGLRLVVDIPAYSTHPTTKFDPRRWDPAQTVKLITPALVDGRRVGVHPVTGQVFPAVAIGAIAPGSGNPANGMVLSGQGGYNDALILKAGLNLAPRFGFAWDPFGNGKTAVRGGFGIFHSSGSRGDGTAGSELQFPLLNTVNVPYGSMSGLLGAPGLQFPQGVSGRAARSVTPSSYNMSFGIQRNVGFGTVVDIGYVGTLDRHLTWGFDISPVAVGANFDPRNADPTNPRVPLPAVFLRPYQGYTGVTITDYGATSNYHSLQASVSRRFTAGLQTGVSWTWSKSLNTVEFDGNTVSPFTPVRVWNYGLSSFDRTHVLKANFLYDLPKSRWNNSASRWTIEGWQISGIASFVSGAPAGVGASFVNATDITGTASQGARIVVNSNPVLPKSERTFDRNFRTDVFAPPAVGTFGNSARTVLRGPGINNWDLGIYKSFPVREPFRIQFRAELYNAFNHTQFSSFDTGARFDAQGRQVNALLGQFTGSRNPRQVQLAIRATF